MSAPAGDARFAEYLGALAQKLDGTTRDNERALDEIAAHLADAAAAEAAAGHAPDEAVARAIARVGSVDEVAARFAAAVDDPRALRVGLRAARVAMTLLFVAGLAGFLAEPIAWLLGRDAFVRDHAVGSVSPARCAQLMKLHHMSDCAAALQEDDFGELVEFGLAAAVVAALALLLLRAILRRIDPLRGRARLDAWMSWAGAALFFACAFSDFAAPTNGRELVGGSLAAVTAIAFAARAGRHRQTT